MSFIEAQKNTLTEMKSTLEARIKANKEIFNQPSSDKSAEAQLERQSIKNNTGPQINMDSEQLQFTVRALNLIGSNRYGICFDCDESIGQPRLKACPTAVRCTDCA